MFVTTIVVSFIVFHKPFTVMRRPIIRDIVFFIFSLIVVLLMLFYDDKMHYWQPMTLLIIYFFYVMTVVFGSSFRSGKFLCFEWETPQQKKLRLTSERHTKCDSSIRPKMMFTGKF